MMNDELNYTLLDNVAGNIPVIESIEADLPQTKSDTTDEVNLDLDTNVIGTVESIENVGNPTEEKETKETKTETPVNTDDSVIRLKAEFLKESGVIDFEDDEFEDNEDWIGKKLDSKVKAMAEEALDPVIKEINDKYKMGVPLDELLNIRATQNNLDSITDKILEEDIDLQEDLVRGKMKAQNEDPEDIEDTIKRFKAADMLKDEAVKAKKFLKKDFDKKEILLEENAKRELETRKERQVQIEQDIKTTIDSATEFIKGIPLTSDQKSKLYQAITKRDKDGLTEYQKLLRDKDNFYAAAQFLVIMNGNLEKVKNIANTKATLKVKETLNTYTEKPSATLDTAKIRKVIEAMRKNRN